MAYQFKLPDIGEGVAEAEIVKWLVAVGDTVAEDQPLVEVLTDKATVEIPSPRAGRVASLGGAEGDADVTVVLGKDTPPTSGGGTTGSSTTSTTIG